MPTAKQPTSLENQIHSAIASAATTLTAALLQEIARQVAQAIGGHAAAPASAAPPSKAAAAAPSPPKGASTKASKRAALDELLNYIAAHPGRRAEEITKDLGGDRETIKSALAVLVAKGKARRAGKARGTTYEAVSAAARSATAKSATAKSATAKSGTANSGTANSGTANSATKVAARTQPAAVPTAVRKQGGATRSKPAKKPTAKKPAGGAKRRAPKKGKSFVRRSPEEIAKTVSDVLGFIGKNPALRSEEIAKGIGGDPKSVGDALARLRTEKRLKTKGERRAMRYSIA